MPDYLKAKPRNSVGEAEKKKTYGKKWNEGERRKVNYYIIIPRGCFKRTHYSTYVRKREIISDAEKVELNMR